MTGQVRAAYPGILPYPESMTALKVAAVLAVAGAVAGVRFGYWLGERRTAG